MNYYGDKYIYCTAGMVKINILPNGDVYRCSADYNYGHEPLFNILDPDFNMLKYPALCTHDACSINCDITDNQRFIFNKDKNEYEETHVELIGNENNTHQKAMPFFCNTIHGNKLNTIWIVWLPSFKCNFNCFYCNYGDKAKPMPRSANPEISEKHWIEFFEKIYDLYDWGRVGIAGGEPMLHDATIPVMELMANKFMVHIITNMSKNIYALSRANVPPLAPHKSYPLGSLETGLCITGSIHPTSRTFNAELFKASALLLKNNGFPVDIALVGHPQQLFLAQDWKDWADKYGILFALYKWNGGDHDGNFASLTLTEDAYLQKFLRYSSLSNVHDDKLYHTDSKDDFPNLSDEQRAFLGALPRKRARAITMRRWSIAITGTPAALNCTKGEPTILCGNIKNLSDTPFYGSDPDKAFKVGGRLFSSRKMSLASEYRAALPDELLPGEETSFRMYIDTANLAEGHYKLKLDVVKEGEFWLDQKGSTPWEIAVSVTD